MKQLHQYVIKVSSKQCFYSKSLKSFVHVYFGLHSDSV